MEAGRVLLSGRRYCLRRLVAVVVTVALAGLLAVTEGTYGIYLGNSSDLSGLPLQGTFTMAATPAARQVVITAPSTMQPGQAATVQVQLTTSGDQTLPDVQLALQLPQGWTATPAGPTDFTSVAPGTAPTATFQVTPPATHPTPAPSCTPPPPWAT